jgi:hypothetical protein
MMRRNLNQPALLASVKISYAGCPFKCGLGGYHHPNVFGYFGSRRKAATVLSVAINRSRPLLGLGFLKRVILSMVSLNLP